MTYGRPGVYVTERLLPAPIAGGGTATAAGAALGQFGQGPEAVTLVTSWYDFVKKFGGYDSAYPASFGVGQFFKNGGTELYVRRVLGADAVAASASIPGAVSGVTGTVTAKSKGVDGNLLRIQLTSSGQANYYNLTVYKELGTDSGSTLDDVILETFQNVRFDDSASSDFITTVVAQESAYVDIVVSNGSTAPSLDLIALNGGDNGVAATAAEFEPAVAEFGVINRPLVIFAPEVIRDLGEVDGTAVHDAIISWAASNDGFAVIDTAAELDVTGAQDYATGRGISSNAAVYYPHIYIADPLGRNAASLRKVGPAGSVAGIYLSVDRQFGPFKAPAGIRQPIGGAVATERQFSAAELDGLNTGAFPLNAIRQVPGAGVVVMGTRTLKQDGTPSRYVNTKRSLIHLKRRLEETTQFALFENNDERLWARLRTSISVLLNEYRNQGGLRGTTEAEAFFVKIDKENNTDATIANGEVHIEVGVALEYPAEFVVITLSQKTSN